MICSAEAAQHVHNAVADDKAASPKGKYKPKLLQRARVRDPAKLSELIIPADEMSGSALDAGAAEFIDLYRRQNNDESGRRSSADRLAGSGDGKAERKAVRQRSAGGQTACST